jgi:hypothetical protein
MSGAVCMQLSGKAFVTTVPDSNGEPKPTLTSFAHAAHSREVGVVPCAVTAAAAAGCCTHQG